MDCPQDTSENRVAAEQARQNLSTRHQWGFYDSHRRSMEKLIVPENRGGRICVLGAGNCNDLDLKWLADVYREVHLVDLDAESLKAGVGRQKMTGAKGLHCHAPVDLTGIALDVARWESAPPTDDDIAEATRRAMEWPTAEWGKFDLVLSPCVMTQTINPARNALCKNHPPSHPARMAIQSALRLRHLRWVAGSLAPGGRGVLAIDLISTRQFPELPRVPRDRLSDMMRTLVANGKHYAGLDSASISAACRNDAELSRKAEAPRFSEPWLWHLGLCKSFLVYGTTMRSKKKSLAKTEEILAISV